MNRAYFEIRETELLCYCAYIATKAKDKTGITIHSLAQNNKEGKVSQTGEMEEAKLYAKDRLRWKM